MKYTHLNLEERERLYALKEQGYSFRQISNILNRAHTTLSREYKRNAPYIDGEYIPIRAHNRTKERGRKQRLKAPLKSPQILLYVRRHLKEYGWSPEAISGRLKLEKDLNIHQETIYRYIYNPSNRKEQLWKYLTYKRKKRKTKYGRNRKRENKLINRISIDKRPKYIQFRNEPGHWETDLMEGTRQSKPALLVNVERKYRYTKIAKIPSKNSISTKGNMIRLLKRFNPISITADNGLENAKHRDISKRLNTNFFFCHPYSSWEKGTVENRIGVIRRYIPKGSDLTNYSHKQIKQLEKVINNRPMKCLDWHTPTEMMRKEGHL